MIRVMTEKGLSGNALKVIAIVAMTIDHLACWPVASNNREVGYFPCSTMSTMWQK